MGWSCWLPDVAIPTIPDRCASGLDLNTASASCYLPKHRIIFWAEVYTSMGVYISVDASSVDDHSSPERRLREEMRDMAKLDSNQTTHHSGRF